ncbi:MAG: right-handed parallel beta-helix repeat-containing protein [Rhodothermales bacterium]
MRFFLGIFLFMAATPAAAQTTYHVAPGGSDAGNGSAGAPWATLQHAADRADTPGDTVKVANGAYTGFNSQHDGIVFWADGDDVVVNVAGSYSGLDHINIENNDDIVVAGFVVRDAPRAGIRVVNAARVTVRNNAVGPNGKWGIFSGFAKDIRVIDNTTFGSAGEHGIYISNSDGPDDAPVVFGNVSYGNAVNGIQFNGDCYAGGDGILENGLIDSNVVFDNGAKGLSIISAPGVRIQNNVIYENRRGAAGAAGIHLVDEPGCGKPTTDAIVVNNTVIEPRMAGIRINDGATRNVIFNNLIVSGNPIADEEGGNRIDGASNVTASSVDGLFMDAGGFDFRLADGAAAIDAGVLRYESVAAPQQDGAGWPRVAGGAPDAGAYEFGAAGSVGTERPVPASPMAVYPNPFTSRATLEISLPASEVVDVALYDLLGRRVATVLGGSGAGQLQRIELDGNALPAGVYFVRVEGRSWSRVVPVVRSR